MANIHDIARLSGFSTATVSRVINQPHYVAPSTRAAIQAVIDQLDYVPSTMAQNLSAGKTRTIGVILPHTDHPYFEQLVTGILNAAMAGNYHAVILPSRYDQSLEQDYLEDLRRHAYDGLIFTSHGLGLRTIAKYQIIWSYCSLRKSGKNQTRRRLRRPNTCLSRGIPVDG